MYYIGDHSGVVYNVNDSCKTPQIYIQRTDDKLICINEPNDVTFVRYTHPQTTVNSQDGPPTDTEEVYTDNNE